MDSFSKLFNEWGEMKIMFGHLNNCKKDRNYMFCRCMYLKEVRQAIRKMKNDKEIGLYNISIEAWKCMGDESVL